jgi:hypothetical protein
MPENLPTFGAVERNIGDGAVALQRAVQIPEFLAIDLREDDIGADILGDVSQERSGGGLPGFGGDRRGVPVAEIEKDIDFRVRLVLELFKILLPQFLE